MSAPKTQKPPVDQLPERNWYEQLNLLNVTVILFLFLTILSGKNLFANSRQADLAAGIRYFF